MNRGFYYACNGMIMNQRKLDCIGNNLTNMYTPGYKRDTIITNRFQEQMILVKHREEFPLVCPLEFMRSIGSN